MAIEFECGICGKLWTVPDDKAGRRGKCGWCGRMIIVPDPSDDVADLAVNVVVPPSLTSLVPRGLLPRRVSEAWKASGLIGWVACAAATAFVVYQVGPALRMVADFVPELRGPLAPAIRAADQIAGHGPRKDGAYLAADGPPVSVTKMGTRGLDEGQLAVVTYLRIYSADPEKTSIISMKPMANRQCEPHGMFAPTERAVSAIIRSPSKDGPMAITSILFYMDDAAAEVKVGDARNVSSYPPTFLDGYYGKQPAQLQPNMVPEIMEHIQRRLN